MNTFIETSLRNFCSTHNVFGDSSVYMHFEEKLTSNEQEYGLTSGITSGHIVFLTRQNQVKTSVPLLLKNMIPKPFCQDYIQVQYFNEVLFYTRALPLLQKYGNLETMLPKFYDSYIHSGLQNTEIILIYEDLKASGFRDQDHFSFLDLDHLTMMLRGLGKFHSFSYLAKSKNPREFNALGNWFKYANVELIRNRPNYFHLFGQIGLQRLRQDPRYSSHIARVEKILENADALVIQANTKEQEEPMSVLCHGDYLRGNVMFCYEDGKPVDMKIIDMATCRLASPVMDLSLVLYLHTDQQMRNRHWDHLIDAYYEGLCQLFGGDGVPSKESILKEFPSKAIYGYLIASHFLPTLINKDRGMVKSFCLDYLPSEFVGCPLSEIPENIFKDMINGYCNAEDARAEALADILRDLIDRNLI